MNRKYLLIIAIIGIIVSIVASATTLQVEIDKQHDGFINKSELIFNNVWSTFNYLIDINDNITLMFNTSDEVNEDQFSLFTKPILTRYPFIENIYYIPRINKINIEKIEKQKQYNGYTGFKFRKFKNEKYNPSPVKKYIFPIEFVQPFTVATSILVGRDIMTFKQVQQSIMLSTKLGDTTVLAPAKNNLYAFSSLYYGKEIPDSNLMNVDNVYAILGFKISLAQLKKHIALPDSYDLQIIINDIEFLINKHKGNKFYKRSKTYDFNGQNITVKITKVDKLENYDYTLSVFVLFTGLILTFLIWSVFRKNIEFNNILYRQNKIIEAEVNEKTEQIKNQSRKLEIANEDQLTAINELKTFSYSISHDLRAPLRSIGGFCGILAEDYAEVLDEQGRNYLNRVSCSAEYMSSLIESMLELAVVTHKKINTVKVPLSIIATEIIAHLQNEQPERKVDVSIADDITVMGDRILLHSVMENLLNNAWKFTQKMENAYIEFNQHYVDGELFYYIKDNGIGFDMSYAKNLFVPFQRLHGNDFEGTGVGLATIERIIKRHRGTISAMAKPNEGATFSFTIGKSNEKI